MKAIYMIMGLLWFFSCSSEQKLVNNTDEMMYVDRFENVLTKSEYEALKGLPKTSERKISDNITMISQYGQYGHISLKDREKILSYLDQLTKRYIDRDATVFITYYPGKDPCNSSGSRTYNQHYAELKDLFKQEETVEIIGIYKDSSGLSKSERKKQYEDPNDIIEDTFFQKDYRCSSYLILGQDGDFITQFGEYGLKRVVEDFNRLVYGISEDE